MASFTTSPASQWNDYDIYTNQGVPKGAIAEIVCCNGAAGTNNTMGVRTYGSSINRYMAINEAEAGGENCCPFLVTVDSSTGKIQLYTTETANYFRLLGYWTNVTYTEENSAWESSSGSDWVDRQMSQANRIYTVYATEINEAQYDCGVRTKGSSLDRRLRIHECENLYGDVGNHLMFYVKSDSSGYIQYYRQTAIRYRSYGYFGSELDFVEKWDQIQQTSSAAWQDNDLTSYLDQDGRVVAFMLTNGEEAQENEIGVRTNGSSLTRIIDVHESEGAGAGNDTEFNGYTCCVLTDGSGIIELYMEDSARDKFMLLGYFKPVTTTLKEVTDSLGLTETVLRNKGLCIVTDGVGATESLLKDFTGTIADILGLTDSVYRHRPLVEIPDSAGLADLVLCDKTFTITDSLGLSEITDVFKQILKQVTDALGLGETLQVNKTMTITDLLQATDAVLLDKALTILDSLSLTDLAMVFKLLLITDSVSLAEIIDIVKWVLKEATDSVGLTETLKLDKTLTLTDAVSALDTVLRDKVFTITDDFVLSDTVLGDKVLLILDAVGLTEQALTHKSMIIADSVLSSDLVQANKNLIVLDTVGLTDSVLRDRLIFILDTLGLSDAVIVIPYVPWSGLYIVLDLKTRSIQLVVSKRDLVLELKKRSLELRPFE